MNEPTVPVVPASALLEMEARKDAAYLERNQVVAALAKCFPSGIARTAIESWSDDWHGCVYIDLPTGQASWHFHDSHAHLFADLPPYKGAWDGHDTPEKYRRLAALAAAADERRDAERYRALRPYMPRVEIRYWTGEFWEPMNAEALDAFTDGLRDMEQISERTS